jgi:hypothetical protein
MRKFEETDRGNSLKVDRRTLLHGTGLPTAATLTGGFSLSAAAKRSGPASTPEHVSGRRKLGSLEVSAIDLCFLMTRENSFCFARRFFLMAGFESLKASLNSIGNGVGNFTGKAGWKIFFNAIERNYHLATQFFDNRGHDIFPDSSQGRRLKEMSRCDLQDSVVRFGSERHSQAKILPE